jgi:hypothetical protein
VRVVLAAGLALLALAIVVRVARPPLAVIATNVPGPEAAAGVATSNQRFCEEGETLPAGTTALRLGISVNIGPRVAVTVLSGGRVIAQGSQAAGWTGEQIAIPIAPQPTTVPGVDVCVALGPTLEPIALIGRPPGHGETLGRLRIEYVHPGPRSWWSLLAPVARRMGRGRSPSGTWVAVLALVLMLAAAALATWLLLRQLGGGSRPAPAPIAGAQVGAPRARAAPGDSSAAAGGRPLASGRPRGGRRLAARLRAGARRVPRAAWACGAVAWLSAASWSVVSAPLQVPDEPAHFAYVQGLAEQGTLPHSSSVEYAPVEMVALRDLDHNEVRYNALHGTISTPVQQQRLESDLANPPPGAGEGAGVAWSQPPLYYALQTIPYSVAGALGGNLLARLALMRLASALLAGLTAIFAYLFLREALPGAPWAWAVGGLAVALFPLVGFMSGAVNPDAGLSAVSAALFYCVARAFRRGLTQRMAVAIGVVTAVGLVTKLNFIGLVPGLAVALVLLAWRERSRGRAALRSPAVAAAIGASPVCVYAVVNVLSGHPTLGLASAAGAAVSRNGLLGELSYVWQFYLPRLPGMAHDFPGLLSTRLWFDRSVGLYGWLDTPFPQWVYDAATLPAAAILALCAAALYSVRAELRRRAPELLAYAAMALGLLVLIGLDSYMEYPGRAGGYTEPRYLLPLTALFGAVFALAARGAGRRWGPAVGAALVVLVLGHDVFSQLLTVARYYG